MVGARREPLSRELILGTTRDLIAANGLRAVSLRGLAARLGVTAPALYGYVTDKDELFRMVAEHEFGALLARFEGVHEADPVARIRAQNLAYVAHARENPELFEVMFLFQPRMGDTGAVPDGADLPAATRTFAAAADAVAEAIADGALVGDDPLLVALTLWSAAHGVASVLRLGLPLPPAMEDDLVREVIDRTLRGYGAVI